MAHFTSLFQSRSLLLITIVNVKHGSFIQWMVSFCNLLLSIGLQAEAEETEVEKPQLHYQQTSISHTCKTVKDC